MTDPDFVQIFAEQSTDLDQIPTEQSTDGPEEILQVSAPKVSYLESYTLI